MIDIQLVSPGGVVTIVAQDGSSWSARLSAGLWDAEDGLLAETEGRIDRIPFASQRDRADMLDRVANLSSDLLDDESKARVLSHVRRSGYYVSED